MLNQLQNSPRTSQNQARKWEETKLEVYLTGLYVYQDAGYTLKSFHSFKDAKLLLRIPKFLALNFLPL